MSRLEKALKRLKQEPTDFSWSEVERILKQLGYEKDEQRSGSRVVFYHPERNDYIGLHKPHGPSGSTMRKGATRNLKDHLEKWGDL